MSIRCAAVESAGATRVSGFRARTFRGGRHPRKVFSPGGPPEVELSNIGSIMHDVGREATHAPRGLQKVIVHCGDSRPAGCRS